ncbi:MAG TPA: penicillin-binding transpeptidase domain-containing protein [Pseudonocardiaceae bacterium]|jgi:beta-lactamase class D|nr:penicillin-binding transpeptidase domain-containing protein [Pseudonocardiaceae bacterium]
MRNSWRALGVLLTVTAAVVVSGCGSTSPPTAQAITQDFLTALGNGDLPTAAKWTTDSVSAQKFLTDAHKAMSPYSLSTELGPVTTSGSSATADYTLTWKLGPDATWTDPSSLKLTQDKAADWRVSWAPSILAPKLVVGQTLARAVTTPAEPTVLGSDGSTLLASTNVISVQVYAAQAGNLNSVATSLAGALSQFDPTITAPSIVDGATKAGSAGYLVVSLRNSDYQHVKSQIYNLPGVRFGTRTELLAPQKNLGAAILPAVRAVAQAEVTTQSGLTVAIEDAQGNELQQVYTKPAGTAAPLTSTLSSKVQAAAESALGTVPQQAMAVVLQPSTGDILAVAANPQAVAAGDNPLTGLYPPGSTFKIATASAALQAGKVTTSTPEPCPGTTTIEGKVIPNEGQFDLGTVPLTDAFAQSCNTTFSQVAAGLSATALPTAAKQLGIGVDFAIPNFTTNTGSVPSDSDVLARAEDGFGQGKDQVSPFGMAMVAATVAHGSTPTPVLMAGRTTTSDTKPIPLPAATRSSVQTLMRAVVTTGTAKSIAGITPPVFGKTGTAQFGDGTHSHGWFVGYQGDLAFAFLLVDAGTSTPAVTVAGHFLTTLAG